MPIRIVTVDAFTSVPFAGNPAAVCILNEPRSEDWLRNVAREMNLEARSLRGGELAPRVAIEELLGVQIDHAGHDCTSSASISPGFSSIRRRMQRCSRAANCAKASSHSCASGTTSSAAAEGVGARTSAAKSAMVKSIS